MALDWPAIERLFFDFFLLFSPQKAPKFASRAHSDNGAETTPPPTHTHTHKNAQKRKKDAPKKKGFSTQKIERNENDRPSSVRSVADKSGNGEEEKKEKFLLFFLLLLPFLLLFLRLAILRPLGRFFCRFYGPLFAALPFSFLSFSFLSFFLFFFVIFQPAASIRLLTEFEIDFYRVCNR